MSYTKTAVLPVTVDEAFALVTEPERLRRWQVVTAVVDLRTGGEYRWAVTPGHVAGGTFREVEPGRRIVFGWGWEGSEDLPPDASTVTITLEPLQEGCLVTLVHKGLTPEQATAHAEGWNHFVDRLEQLATTGDAGPDAWAWAPESLDPFSAAEAVLAVVQPVLRGLTPEDQPKPTPCPEWDCHGVASHLLDSLVGLGAMAGVSVSAPEQVGGSLENRVSVLAAQAIQGWRRVDLAGTVSGPGGAELPTSMAAGLMPVEILLHGWDLAQGSGQPMRASDELVDYLRALAEPMMPMARERGSFGPEVTAAEGAGALERLAAYAGRAPIA